MSPVSVTNRHSSQGAPPKGWNCVSCGGANAGPLEAGCALCGAGKPGEHVGVPPPARSRLSEPLEASGAPFTGNLNEAFIHWRKTATLATGGLDGVEEALYVAFSAGYQLALTTVVHAPPLPGTAESRTIVAALRRFLEEVLPLATEEIASGEYLSVEQVEALIAKLERTQ